MNSKNIIQKIKKDISSVSVSLSIDSIDSIIFEDKELDYLINLNDWLINIIQKKIKHMALLGEKLNLLKKHINLLKRNNDINIDNTMYSYEILLDILLIKAEHLTIFQEKQTLILSMIDRKKEYDYMNSSLEIIVLTH